MWGTTRDGTCWLASGVAGSTVYSHPELPVWPPTSPLPPVLPTCLLLELRQDGLKEVVVDSVGGRVVSEVQEIVQLHRVCFTLPQCQAVPGIQRVVSAFFRSRGKPGQVARAATVPSLHTTLFLVAGREKQPQGLQGQ